jgi:hypothetical protein
VISPTLVRREETDNKEPPYAARKIRDTMLNMVDRNAEALP